MSGSAMGPSFKPRRAVDGALRGRTSLQPWCVTFGIPRADGSSRSSGGSIAGSWCLRRHRPEPRPRARAGSVRNSRGSRAAAAAGRNRTDRGAEPGESFVPLEKLPEPLPAEEEPVETLCNGSPLLVFYPQNTDPRHRDLRSPASQDERSRRSVGRERSARSGAQPGARPAASGWGSCGLRYQRVPSCRV